MELQKDTHMIEAEQSLALLLELLNNSQHEFQKTETQYKTYLENWNLKAHKDSIAPTLYHILWEELKSELWSKKLPDPRVYIWPNFEVTLRILRGEIAIDVKPEEVVLKSFMKAVDRLESLENKLWGDYNQAHFPHLLRIPSWGRFVSESGAETTVNAQDKNHGTTLRMVVSMSTPPRVWGLYPGGVSGDPANPSYDKGIKDWTTDRLPEWNFPKSPFDLDSLSLALDLSFEGRRRQ